jgi:hypothetical protein
VIGISLLWNISFPLFHSSEIPSTRSLREVDPFGHAELPPPPAAAAYQAGSTAIGAAGIAGIIVGVVVFCAAVAAVSFSIWKKGQNNLDDMAGETEIWLPCEAESFVVTENGALSQINSMAGDPEMDVWVQDCLDGNDGTSLLGD